MDIPIRPASITVHSTINPDSTFQVQLSASQNILSDNNFPTLTGAKVDIYEGEKFIETLVQNKSGTYEGAQKPSIGRGYKIEVSKENFLTVQATDQVPNGDITLSSVLFVRNAKDEYNQQLFTMTVEFDDPNGENYYEIGLYGQGFVYDWDNEFPVITDTVLVQYYLDSEDVIFGDDFYYSDAFWPFSDDIVDGKRVKIDFSTYLYPLYDVDELEVTVVLREISYNLYKYKQTANLQQSLSGDPFAEPVPVYNTIENGYGVFGAYQQTTAKVLVKKEN